MKRIKNNNKQAERIYGLDILRSVAILFVVYEHGGLVRSNFISSEFYALTVLDGVSMFFVLSGFLIGGILIRTIERDGFQAADLLYFWRRRWFRTLPNYFLVLILVIMVEFARCRLNGTPFPGGIARYFFFLQNFCTPHPSFFGEAWSLSVEEWFYFLIPVLLFLLYRVLKFPVRQLLLILILSVIVVVTMVRTHLALLNYYQPWDAGIRHQVVTRLDSIMFGVAGAWLYYYKKPLWERHKNVLFVAGILLIIFPNIHLFLRGKDMFFDIYFTFVAASMGTLLILPKLNSIKKGRGFFLRFFTFISIISYAMYLVNLSVVLNGILPVLTRVFHLPDTGTVASWFARYLMYWLFTIAFSWLLYTFYELPFMNLRERYKKRHN